MKKWVAIESVIVVLMLAIQSALFPGDLYAGANQLTSQGQPLRWKPGVSISYVVNPGGVPGFAGELERLVVAGAISDAFRAWTEIPDAAIVFTNAGTSSRANGALDGVNLVSFQDTLFPFLPGVLAVAVTLSATAPGPTFVGDQIVEAEFAGQILDSDILFNPRLSGTSSFSPIGADNSVDFVAVALHEVGHLLGLDHTGVFSSSMNPFAESGAGVASRILQSDDAITAAALYPSPGFASARGTITGTVTSSVGAAIKSAHVVAVREPGAVPVASQLSGSDGRFEIKGLPHGNYRVLVEPLDGPINLLHFPGFYSTGQSNFTTTFFGGLASPATVAVAAGQPATANVILPATPPTPLNITQLGIITRQPDGRDLFTSGPVPQFLPRGKSPTEPTQYQLFAIASNQGSDSNLAFAGAGITGQATTGGKHPNEQAIRQQNITISPAAPIGPSNVLLSNATSTSAFPGGLITTVNPTIVHPSGEPVREGAGFRTTVAPGTIISIFGSDLAFGRGAGGIEGVVATPLPTFMGGVSVKIGNRFAPLFFVSPAQINALLPFEITGTSTQITVVTGPNASGNTVTVNLSPTAPGIFSTDSSGTGQGAILNGLEQNQGISSLVAPGGSFPQARPARRGEVIVIFASGLGPVTPALPSGLASGGGGTAVPTMVNLPRVLIGGQQATVHFAGLAPTFVGLFQVNAEVPTNAPTGNAVPVQITTVEGQTSNTVTIAISP